MPRDPLQVRSDSPRHVRHSHARLFFSIALLLLGMLGAMAAWLIVAVIANNRAGWMALLVASAVVLLLRIGGFPSGVARASTALLATASCIVASYWLVSALPIGAGMGQWPFVAASHMGLDFAWTLTRLGNTPVDWIFAGIALLLAAWFAS